MGLSLLRYRPWEGKLRGAWASPWPIARTALRMVFRRKLFWVLYLLALLNFMVFASGYYLLSQIRDLASEQLAGAQAAQSGARLMGFSVRNVDNVIDFLERRLNLGGDARTYRNFFWLQGYVVMAVLALAGSILVGNDYQHGSLSFYLSKPLGRWHYLGGKFLAAALFVNMMTTIPALVLFLEYGLLNDWSYFGDQDRLFWGILGYGAVLTVVLTLMVVATASWLRKTMPMIMVWVGLLFFCRLFAKVLVENLNFNHRWRLIDVWNNLYIVGSECLGTAPSLGTRPGRPPQIQPEAWEAALVLAAVCVACLTYLSRRIRAVEIVR
jgi:ABC-2 type transport system permease protein